MKSERPMQTFELCVITPTPLTASQLLEAITPALQSLGITDCGAVVTRPHEASSASFTPLGNTQP